MPAFNSEPGKGIYNAEYFSGAQVAVYIGNVWVDEITSITYEVSQRRTPLYGYADQLYRDLAVGQVLVTGSFTINFKESGYMFLILNEYRKMQNGNTSLMIEKSPFNIDNTADRNNISQIMRGETSAFQRNKVLQDLVVSWGSKQFQTGDDFNNKVKDTQTSIAANLGGFSSNKRLKKDGQRTAEDAFESFEDEVWEKTDAELNNETRRADDHRLNPFDIYLAYGDFMGDNSVNHTIRKLVDVSITGMAQEVVIDGMPIQEQYSFIAKNIV